MNPDNPPRRTVSVVIPTLNAGVWFYDLLEALARQRTKTSKTDFDTEIVVVDSGSRDGTAELARRYGATVHGIPKSEFNHGATRNFGISLSRGEYVALVVQDALPVGDEWLSAMVEDLDADERVAGVYGRQIPRPEADPLTRALVGGMASAANERREQYLGEKTFDELPPPKRRRLSAFDNVSSCLRRSVWEELPLDWTNFGEDIRWGKKVVNAGHKVVYEPRSAVVHSHERGAMYDLRRYYADQKVLAELFDLKSVPTLYSLARVAPRAALRLYGELRKDERLAGSPRSRVALTAFRYAAVSQLGNYLAVRGEDLRRIYPEAHERFERYLGRGV